jgi:beta-1,3-galactosyltransferase 1
MQTKVRSNLTSILTEILIETFSVKYVMKTDDDTLVNVPNLVHILLDGTIPANNATSGHHNKKEGDQRLSEMGKSDKKYLVMGFPMYNGPVRDRACKWYVSEVEYKENSYPYYVRGSGYVMTSYAAEKLYEVSFSESVVYVEDVFVTGILTRKVNFTLTFHPLFSIYVQRNYCSYRGMAFLEEMSSPVQREIFFASLNLTNKCD